MEINEKRSGFEDDPTPIPCLYEEHNPPMHLYVPPGKQYRHVCPSCGYTIVIRPGMIL